MQIPGGASVDAQRVGVGGQVALLACGLFATIGLFSPGLLLPQLEQAFAGTPNVDLLVPLVGTIASFSFAVAAPGVGALLARFGCRAVIIPSLILLAVAGTAPAMLDNLWAMVATRAVVGAAVAGVFTAGLTGIGSLSDANRARMFGWYGVVGGATAILVFPAVGAIARTGWRLPFAIHLVALLMLPLAFLLPKALGRAARRAPGERRGESANLFGPAMVGLLIVAAYAGMCMLLAPIYAPLYLGSLGITDTRLLAIPVTLSAVCAAISAAVYGPAQRFLGIAGVFAAILIGIGGVLLVAGTTDSVVIFCIALGILGGLMGLVAPNISAAALAAAPEKGGEAMGLANGVMFGSQLLFPFIATWIRSQAGLGAVLLVFAAAALGIGVTILARMTVIRRRVVQS